MSSLPGWRASYPEFDYRSWTFIGVAGVVATKPASPAPTTPTAPVKAFMDKGEDFIVATNLTELVHGMIKLTGENLIELAHIEKQIAARDREMDNKFTKDLQITAMRGARNYLGDKLIRAASPHKILDPKNGPLIAVRLNILSRKTLGGLQTDLSGRVLNSEGNPVPGL